MKKKDYELIASCLKLHFNCFKSDINYQSNIKELIETFTRHLSRKNPRFNREKFLMACGVEVERNNHYSNIMK